MCGFRLASSGLESLLSPQSLHLKCRCSSASGPACCCLPVRPVVSVSRRLMVYPPPPAKGGISVTNEDLHCLNDGEFLNDVIIDFYLK